MTKISTEAQAIASATHVAAMPPFVLDIAGTCAALSCSRTVVYELLARRELTRVKIGRRTLVTVQSVKALVARAARPAGE